MGLSSSQARLLHLTARMHQIEYKAAKLEAQKLQMANKSRRVYQEYQEALEATKIQYKSLNEDASITFRDATADILQNGCVPGYEGETSAKQYFLQDMDGKIMITKTVADFYHLNGSSDISSMSLNEYLVSLQPNISKSQRTIDNPETIQTNEVESFNKVGNTVERPGQNNYTPPQSAINKTTTKPTYNINCLQTNSFDSIPTNRVVLNNDTISLSSNTTYVINDQEGLMTLARLAHQTEGVTIILNTSNITLGEDWNGINNFKGTFDGHGNTITINGTQGLFTTTENARIKNVIVDANITGGNNSSSRTGGIVGKMSGGTIENCYVHGSLSGSAFVGGICGHNNNGTIRNCNADINITQTATRIATSVDVNNGLAEYEGQEIVNNNAQSMGGIVGNDSGGYIEHCQTKGSITGRLSGGIVGNHTLGDYNNHHEPLTDEHLAKHTHITDCYSECDTIYGLGDTSAGGLIGWKEGFCTEFSGNNTYWSNRNYTGISKSELNNIKVEADIADVEHVQKLNRVTVPSINNDGSGGLYSNLYAALLKYNNNDLSGSGLTENDIKQYILKVKNYKNQKIDINNHTQNVSDPELIANLNYYLTKYLNNELGASNAFIDKISLDIKNKNATYTNQYMGEQGSARISDYEGWAIDISTENDTWSPVGENGKVYMPTAENIAKQLFCVLNKQDHKDNNFTWETVNSWINTNYSNDKEQLAYLNEAIQESINNNYSTITNGNGDDICNLINNGTQWTSNRTDYSERYNFIDKSDNVNITYKTELKHHYSTEEFWDPSVPEVAQAMAMWAIAQKGFFIIPADQSSNYLYLKNILETGQAVLTSFDPSKAATAFEGLTAQQVLEMDETKYNEAMNIFNTNVAVETHLQEVADEKNLKKAEAKYEADMRRIDFKDRQYDRELAALDAERNAIKNEMETLKTVAKDNVDRTFKLFS